jgi:hypothetical protein
MGEDTAPEKTTERDLVFIPLSPKTITEGEELKQIQPYLDLLGKALADDTTRNIALMGSYGSGKSSILKSFVHKVKEESTDDTNIKYRFLNISLASFETSKPATTGQAKEKEAGIEKSGENGGESPKKLKKSDVGKSENDLERNVELSILQQMFYHVEPRKLPDSRFKRIYSTSYRDIIIGSLGFAVWLYSFILMFKRDYIYSLDPNNWSTAASINLVAVGVAIIFFIGMVSGISLLYKLLQNSKINKINLKGEIEIGQVSEGSIFNKYLDEILYFFQQTKINVVILEDIDRFEGTELFTKLREINIIINNSDPIRPPVKFIYAVKDDLFADKLERVKFFDAIIPVVPFISASNAGDQLMKLIKDNELDEIISQEFISDTVPFINDIDMRLLINIFQEFQVYYTILKSKKLKADNLLALIIYKNLDPEDFGKLQNSKGYLYDFLAKRESMIKSLKKSKEDKITDLKKDIANINNEQNHSIAELRKIYIFNLIAKIPDGFKEFKLGIKTRLSPGSLLDDSTFKEWIKLNTIEYLNHQHNHRELKFSVIEQEVYVKRTYLEREKDIISKNDGTLKLLESKISILEQKISELENLPTNKIFENNVEVEHFKFLKYDKIVRNLVVNGYLDEHYEDYIALFHGNKADLIFERAVKNLEELDCKHLISEPSAMIKKLGHTKYYARPAILNLQLVNALLEQENANDKIEAFFSYFALLQNKHLDFLYAYIEEGVKKELFVANLCKKAPKLWLQTYNQLNESNPEKLKRVLQHIFDSADYKDITKFEGLESMDNYLTTQIDFFAFCTPITKLANIERYLVERKLKINKLDTATEAQKDLFMHVYEEDCYALNYQNILTVLKGNGYEISEEYLKKQNYTTLRKCHISQLLDYIHSDFQTYVEQVFLKLDTNNLEDEEIVIEMLNEVECLSLNLRRAIITQQNIKISLLKQIEEIEIRKFLMDSNKVLPTWENIDVFSESLDLGILNKFLNKYSNYRVLATLGKDLNKMDEDSVESVCDLIFENDGISLDAYKTLINSLPYVYDNFDFSKVDKSKIEVLIQANILSLTSNNVENLRKIDPNLSLHLMELKSGELVSYHSNNPLSVEEFRLLMESSTLSVKHKIDIYKVYEQNHWATNKSIAIAVFNALDAYTLSDIGIKNLINILSSVEGQIPKKIDLINMVTDKPNNADLEVILGLLGGKYADIVVKGKRPEIDNESHNVILLKDLVAREMIRRFDYAESKLKITTLPKSKRDDTE